MMLTAMPYHPACHAPHIPHHMCVRLLQIWYNRLPGARVPKLQTPYHTVWHIILARPAIKSVFQRYTGHRKSPRSTIHVNQPQQIPRFLKCKCKGQVAAKVGGGMMSARVVNL